MNDEGIFARRERLESEIREAKKNLIREKRTDRELRKLQSGGRVTPFLRREADKSQAVAAAINLATAGNPLALGQAMIQYQSAINESKRDPLKTENNPRPESPREAGGGTATIPPHPWQILLRLNEDEDPEFKVDLNSDLYSGLGDWSEVPITGLDTWIAASTGYVTLKGTVSSGVVIGAEIIGPLVDLPERVVFSGSAQTDFSTLLGYLFFQDGQIAVRQISSQNFTLFNSCVSGNPALYPIAT
jgi:hypothetical protein